MFDPRSSRTPRASAEDASGERLLQFITRMSWSAVPFGIIELVAAIVLRQPRLLLSSAALFFLVGVSLASRPLARSGGTARAAARLGYALLATNVTSSLALPFAYPTLVFAGFLPVLVVLPYLEGSALRRMVLTAFVTILFVLLNGHFHPLPVVLPEWVLLVLEAGGITAAAALSLYLVLQFSNRFRALLGRERAARGEAMFLARASAILSESLDLDTTLGQLGQLAVARLADWFTVSVVEADGVLRRREVAHRELGQRDRVEEYRRCYPPGEHHSDQFIAVMRSGKPIFMPVVTDEALVAGAQNKEHLQLLRGLGVGSCMAVPMAIHHEVVGVLSFMRSGRERPYDLTDLKLAQELAGLAALAVENARLYEKARTAVRLRDEFLGVVGHAMKTPRTTLQLQMEGLVRRIRTVPKSAMPADLLEWVQRTASTGERLARMVDDLLDSAGGLVLRPEPLDLVTLLKEILESYEDVSSQSQTSLVFDLPATLPGIWDRRRISQVVSNLISNGLEYGQGRPVTLQLRARAGEVEIRVSDRGIGISKADQRRIFERFERDTTTLNEGGLGLGLWIVREIVEASGGSIQVESAPGEGATFTVILPRKVDTPATRAPDLRQWTPGW